MRVFEMLDQNRGARHYVYSLQSERTLPFTQRTYVREQWLKAGNAPPNRELAEAVIRSFDQLGLLVREGVVPLNLVARSYAYPAVRCWYILDGYINECRIQREQPGHMWEFENLVFNIILHYADPATRGARVSLWNGVWEHESLGRFATEMRDFREQMQRDKNYAPRQDLWIVSLPKFELGE